MPDDELLISVLESLRERGALGESSLPRAVEHSTLFAAALPDDCRRVIDLGSGGGLPGLVVAVRRPELQIVLTERRERRADLLRLACSRLGVAERVAVVAGDVVDLATDPDHATAFDAATARSFGPPLWTLECARPFLHIGGIAVISEPPPSRGVPGDGTVASSERWPEDAVDALGFRRDSPDGAPLAVLTRT